MGDRIALMRGGQLLQIGTARHLYEHPVDLYAARFFSELNEFEAVAKGGRVETPIGSFGARGHADGTILSIGVRPQGVGFAIAGDGVPGRIVGHQFLGEVDLLSVAVDGIDVPIRMRTRDNTAPYVVGSTVWLSIDRRDVLVFAKPAE